MKRRVVIPSSIKCKECGGTDLIGAGRNEWRRNPKWKPGSKLPKRVQLQRFKCNECGTTFTDMEHGGIINNGKGKVDNVE